jgi:hypothetical protein
MKRRESKEFINFGKRLELKLKVQRLLFSSSMRKNSFKKFKTELEEGVLLMTKFIKGMMTTMKMMMRMKKL